MQHRKQRRWLRRLVQVAVLIAACSAILAGQRATTDAQTLQPLRFPIIIQPGQGAAANCPPNAFARCAPAPAPAPVPTPAQQCPPGTRPVVGATGCTQSPPQTTTTCPPGEIPLVVVPGCQSAPGTQVTPNCPSATELVGNVCEVPSQIVNCPSGTQASTNGQGCQAPATPVSCPAGTQPGANGQGCQNVAPSNPTSVRCPDGSTAASSAGCPTATPSTPSGPAPLAATISISGQNPVKITLHANEYLDLTHSVTFNLDPAVQATGVQVSTGTGAIQGSQVIWNGFTMNAGDDASATVSLVVTGGTSLMASGGPSIQSVTVEALDQSGNQVVQFNPGGGPLTSTLVTACSSPNSSTVVVCTGSGAFSTPQFTVSVNWDLVWSFGSCPDATGTLSVSIVNGDGSRFDSRNFSQPPATNAGTQHYTTGGSFSLSINSACTWSVQAVQD